MLQLRSIFPWNSTYNNLYVFAYKCLYTYVLACTSMGIVGVQCVIIILTGIQIYTYMRATLIEHKLKLIMKKKTK